MRINFTYSISHDIPISNFITKIENGISKQRKTEIKSIRVIVQKLENEND